MGCRSPANSVFKRIERMIHCERKEAKTFSGNGENGRLARVRDSVLVVRCSCEHAIGANRQPAGNTVLRNDMCVRV